MVAFIMTIFLQWRWKQIESVCVGWGGLNLSENLDKQILKKTRLSLWFMSNIAKTVGVGGGSDAYMYVLFLIFITDIYSQPHWFIPNIL